MTILFFEKLIDISHRLPELVSGSLSISMRDAEINSAAYSFLFVILSLPAAGRLVSGSDNLTYLLLTFLPLGFSFPFTNRYTNIEIEAAVF